MGTNVLLPVNAIGIYRGSSATFRLTVTDADGKPVDLTASTVYFTVKKDISDTNPVIRKASTNIAQIEITSARGGIAKVYFEPDDTRNLRECRYVFDAWVVLSTGKRYPVIPPSILEILPSVSVIA